LDEAVTASGKWLPPPNLVALIVDRRMASEDWAGAASLATRASTAFPDQVGLLYLEVLARVENEPERDVLDQVSGRLDEAARRTPEGATLAIVLARRRLALGDADAALDELRGPPPEEREAELWFRVRAQARAAMGDVAGLELELQELAAAGASSLAVDAVRAVVLDAAGLSSDRGTWIELQRRVASQAATLVETDPELARLLYGRLIPRLAMQGARAEALERIAEAEELLGSSPWSRQELATMLAAEQAGPSPPVPLLFHADLPEGTVFVERGSGHAVDVPFEPVRLVGGKAEVMRRAEATPTRWVAVDATGAVRGSGAVWPALAGSRVEIVLGQRLPLTRAEIPASRSGDGRSRVLVLVLDCADWRIVRYLFHRQELPVLAALLKRGRHGVLWSEPAFTASAMRTLVAPGPDRPMGVFESLHELGAELAGLRAFPHNPLRPLAFLLPQESDLFELAQVAGLSTANLLYSHGAINVGVHGALVRQDGSVERVEVAATTRRLTMSERARHPAFSGLPALHDALVADLAARFDTVAAVSADQTVDLVLARIEATDLITHATYSDAAIGRQDDGHGVLFETYRYVDSRLAEIAGNLDADDHLIVMSDHGITSAMRHDPRALFVHTGPGVTPGNLPQRDLSAVPAMIIHALGLSGSE